MIHTPVLLKEVVAYLDPQPGESFIDATFGNGGHALEILKRTAPNGRLLGIDWDPTSLQKLELRGAGGSGLDTGSENLTASEPLTSRRNVGEIRSGIESGPSADKRLVLVHGNFADIAEITSKSHFNVAGVLFDFGFSSNQLEAGGGFSYLRDEPLDMRFYRSGTSIEEKTAAYIVNGWLEEELEKIFREFGEERNSRKIARAIVEERKRRKIKTTGELVEIIDKTYKTNRTYRIKTLSRIFQALRIAVNNELENIKKGLEGAWDILKPNGRIVAISFHSLEDRLVKNFFNEKKMIGLGKVLTRKPVTPSAEEVRENTRARSAKLRAIVKISNI